MIRLRLISFICFFGLGLSGSTFYGDKSFASQIPIEKTPVMHPKSEITNTLDAEDEFKFDPSQSLMDNPPSDAAPLN